MSDYFENKLIDAVFKQQSFTAPANLYIGLFTLIPGDSNSGTEVSTVGTAYTRIACNPSSSANWTTTQGTASAPSTGSSGTTSNLVDIVFPTPTADWGIITSFGLYDSITGGNLWYYGTLVTPITILAASGSKKFPAGSLVITHN